MKEIDYIKEIERLNKKIQIISEAYSQSVKELNQLKEQANHENRRGRPALDHITRSRIISLYSQGESMRDVAAKVGVAVGTVHKIVKKATEQSRNIYVYMDREKPGTVIDVNSITKKVRIINLSDDMITRAFGVNESPDYEDFEEFLESRCMPRTRYGIEEELKKMNIDSYDPYQIVEKTKGRVYGDGQWILTIDKDEQKAFDVIVEENKKDEHLKERLIAYIKGCEKLL